MSIILDGNKAAKEIKEELKQDILALQDKEINPTLAVVLVGSDPASERYVAYKEKDCAEVGIKSEIYRFPEDTTEENLKYFIQSLNYDEDVHGILVQFPLPKHINKTKIMSSIAPLKDVDCFHPENIGAFYMDNAYTQPCTPAGVIELLKRNNVPIAGKRTVVLGRSDIVGKPMAYLLQKENATVTVLHSKTEELDAYDYILDSEIIVSAVGKPDTITQGNLPLWNITLIDIGINFVDGKIVGDIDPQCFEFSEYYTPVPGGVGPMTRAMLLKNTLICTKALNGIV